MLEKERDTYSNECITKATSFVLEAKKMLLSNRLEDATIKDYSAVYMAMRGVLAIDDIFPEDDYGVENAFTKRYIDNGMMSDEAVTTLKKITEQHDIISANPNHKTSKPEAGYFTSKANFFVIEASDYIVQRNALTWGQ